MRTGIHGAEAWMFRGFRGPRGRGGRGHIRYSGSDDTLCKVSSQSPRRGSGVRITHLSCRVGRVSGLRTQVWDRRSLANNRPVGVMVGHREGITHISPKV